MVNETPTADERSVGTLLSGILEDAEKLLKQQLDMFRAEVRMDVLKCKEASRLLVFGIGLLVPGGLVLCLATAYLLHWATGPAGMDPAGLPLWACLGLAGLAFGVPGALLILLGVRTFRAVPEQSAEALVENIQWLTKPK